MTLRGAVLDQDSSGASLLIQQPLDDGEARVIKILGMTWGGEAEFVRIDDFDAASHAEGDAGLDREALAETIEVLADRNLCAAIDEGIRDFASGSVVSDEELRGRR